MNAIVNVYDFSYKGNVNENNFKINYSLRRSYDVNQRKNIFEKPMQMQWCLCHIMHIKTWSYKKEIIDVDEVVIEFC